MADTLKTELLIALVTQLRNEIHLSKGAAAVATLDRITHVAGTEYRDWLMNQSRDIWSSRDLVHNFPH